LSPSAVSARPPASIETAVKSEKLCFGFFSTWNAERGSVKTRLLPSILNVSLSVATSLAITALARSVVLRRVDDRTSSTLFSVLPIL